MSNETELKIKLSMDSTEVMAELKLIHQYIFDLQCEVDRLRVALEKTDGLIGAVIKNVYM